uniref:TB domain-containing protein n=1 Tax=Amphimedon queenslandica TaxID=400682 RepID=A0A1X7UR44_AMPQE
MKTQIFLLVVVLVGVYAVLVSSEAVCKCPGVCMKEVTEDGRCNTGYTIGKQNIGPWKCCKELGGGGYYFYGFRGAPAFCQPCDTVAPNNTGVTEFEQLE